MALKPSRAQNKGCGAVCSAPCFCYSCVPQPPLWNRNLTAQRNRRFYPLGGHNFHILQRVLCRRAVRHAAGQLRDFCDICPILFTPKSITSYFITKSTSELIFQDDLPYLFDLVSLCAIADGLKVDNFLNTVFCEENEMGAFDTVLKPQPSQNGTQVRKLYSTVFCAAHNGQ